MADEFEGASPREQAVEAARRNNPELLQELIDKVGKKGGDKGSPEAVAEFLNTARDGVGYGLLHLAAMNGKYDVLDLLLDQEGVEIDHEDRMEKDTPLHKAVRFVNSLKPESWEDGKEIVDILIDAGCDPRIRNKGKLKPIELVDPRNKDLIEALRKAEWNIMYANDIPEAEADEDEGPTGSASDSD
ncbi:hypothetical protein BDY21DRAFT_65708 [Lineolata rhizophorae]|uniref:Uncharacterized protein n=1 Tax=Lineolata rhizophorae TaxID=578093 RepID=A0A6A6NX25_9PEZI|nr:hypothetical protein BDY21DRAFT_65708 [Lineolata rhizophorae]